MDMAHVHAGYVHTCGSVFYINIYNTFNFCSSNKITKATKSRQCLALG